MKLIVGLGNIGSRYDGTRHNVGFRVVDAVAEKFRIDVSRNEKLATVGEGRIAGQQVMLAKPTTYMNLSGDAVSKLVKAYLDSPTDLIIIYDDVDLPVGKLRIRKDGGAGTHNGMRSVIPALGTDQFPRLRFGIRGESYAQTRDLADYVLDRFDPGEEELVKAAVLRSVDAIVIFARGDLGRAMNEFNRDPKNDSGGSVSV